MLRLVTARQHAHDLEHRVVEANRLPDDRRVRAEAALPDAIGEHDDVALQTVVVCVEQPAVLRLDAQRVEESLGHACALKTSGSGPPV